MAEMSTKDYQRMKQLDSLTKNRKRKNPGDVQRESASKRTREKLKNIAKWKTKTPGRTKAPPTDSEKEFNWKDLLPRRKKDTKGYFLNSINPGIGFPVGIVGGVNRLKDLIKKSGAGYSGSDDYKK